MQCPSCGAAIADGSRQCEYCRRPILSPAGHRGRVPRPQKYHLEDDGLTLRITWRWFHPLVFFLLPFAIAWNAFLVGWYGMATQMPGMPDPMRWIFLVFPLAHVAVGVGLAYAVAAMLVNRSQVLVDRGQLRVSHGPLPWPGVTLDAHEINQVFCSETGARNKEGTVQYQVQARLTDGGAKTLLNHVADASEALFLEQAIEQHLRIRDEPVPGELPRT
jgi:hypothetical protein